MKVPKSVAKLPTIEEVADQQPEIRKWIRELERVESPITKSLERVADAMGCSYQTARTKFYAWKDTEDWHVLINYAKLSYHDKARRQFYSWWRNLCLKSKTVKEAHQKFMQQFKSGKPIPGVSSAQSRDGLPSGFDYNSLIRHAPKKWCIWRNAPNGEPATVTDFDTRFEVIAGLRQIISSGDAIADIRFKGKIVSAKATLALLADAGLKIVRANSNPESTV